MAQIDLPDGFDLGRFGFPLTKRAPDQSVGAIPMLLERG